MLKRVIECLRGLVLLLFSVSYKIFSCLFHFASAFPPFSLYRWAGIFSMGVNRILYADPGLIQVNCFCSMSNFDVTSCGSGAAFEP